MKKTLIFLLGTFILIGSVEDSHARRRDKPRKKDEKSGNTDNPDCSPENKTLKITLGTNFIVPAIRSSSYPVCPIPTPSPWSGSISATGMYDSPNTKYYCLVTVGTFCVNWGESGVKTYLWTSPTNTMNVTVPGNLEFKVTVEYYEPCGLFWNDGRNGRGRWYHEQTFLQYMPQATFNTFLFTNKENC